MADTELRIEGLQHTALDPLLGQRYATHPRTRATLDVDANGYSSGLPGPQNPAHAAFRLALIVEGSIVRFKIPGCPSSRPPRTLRAMFGILAASTSKTGRSPTGQAAPAAWPRRGEVLWLRAVVPSVVEDVRKGNAGLGQFLHGHRGLEHPRLGLGERLRLACSASRPEAVQLSTTAVPAGQRDREPVRPAAPARRTAHRTCAAPARPSRAGQTTSAPHAAPGLGGYRPATVAVPRSPRRSTRGRAGRTGRRTRSGPYAGSPVRECRPGSATVWTYPSRWGPWRPGSPPPPRTHPRPATRGFRRTTAQRRVPAARFGPSRPPPKR
jgi:hypothetical protein